MADFDVQIMLQCHFYTAGLAVYIALGVKVHRNPLCPYCRATLSDEVNKPNTRSVEHLIPNAVLTKPRTKRDGDFFACRRCNSRKGHIDYVLGIVAKAQSDNPDLAASALIAAVNSNDGRSGRFIQMAAEARSTPNGVEAIVPIFGDELLEYISFLGRGQYFRKRGKLFEQGAQVMIVDYVNKLVMSALSENYVHQHGTNPFSDVVQNRYSESFGDRECIIYSKNGRYLFLFHSYTAIIIEIKRRNAKNVEHSRASAEKLLAHFPWKSTSERTRG